MVNLAVPALLFCFCLDWNVRADDDPLGFDEPKTTFYDFSVVNGAISYTGNLLEGESSLIEAKFSVHDASSSVIKHGTVHFLVPTRTLPGIRLNELEFDVGAHWILDSGKKVFDTEDWDEMSANRQFGVGFDVISYQKDPGEGIRKEITMPGSTEEARFVFQGALASAQWLFLFQATDSNEWDDDQEIGDKLTRISLGIGPGRFGYSGPELKENRGVEYGALLNAKADVIIWGSRGTTGGVAQMTLAIGKNLSSTAYLAGFEGDMYLGQHLVLGVGLNTQGFVNPSTDVDAKFGKIYFRAGVAF